MMNWKKIKKQKKQAKFYAKIHPFYIDPGVKNKWKDLVYIDEGINSYYLYSKSGLYIQIRADEFNDKEKSLAKALFKARAIKSHREYMYDLYKEAFEKLLKTGKLDTKCYCTDHAECERANLGICDGSCCGEA